MFYFHIFDVSRCLWRILPPKIIVSINNNHDVKFDFIKQKKRTIVSFSILIATALLVPRKKRGRQTLYFAFIAVLPWNNDAQLWHNKKCSKPFMVDVNLREGALKREIMCLWNEWGKTEVFEPKPLTECSVLLYEWRWMYETNKLNTLPTESMTSTLFETFIERIRLFLKIHSFWLKLKCKFSQIKSQNAR